VRLQRKVAGIKQAHVSSASVELVPIPQAKSSLGLILKNLVELTNDPFDDVEIREFGAVAMKTGCRPPNTLLHSNRQAHLLELRSICYRRSAMAATQSRECASRRVAPSQ